MDARPARRGTSARASAASGPYAPRVTGHDEPAIRLRPWEPGDLGLLERLVGDPGMMGHLGGAESPEQILSRHERYLASAEGDRDRVFAVTLEPGGEAAGWVGYWILEWNGETAWETGWSVLPEHQGRGIATRATQAVIELARVQAPLLSIRSIHAFPSVDNAPSNAICRKAGFTLVGEADVEYPKGRPMRVNDWVLAL